MPLQNKAALLLGILVALALSVSGLHSLRVLDDSLRQSVFSGVRFSSENIADSIARFLDDSQRDIQGIAAALPKEALARGDAAALEAYLQSIAERYPKYQNGLYFLDAEGRLVVDFPPYPEKRGGDYAYREYFSRTMKERRGIIGKPYRSSRTGEPVLPVTAYLTDAAGKSLGVLVGGVMLTSSEALGGVQGQTFGNTGYSYMFDSSRQLILHPERNRILEVVPTGANRLLEAAVEGFEGTGETVNSRGIPMLVSFTAVPGMDWIVAVQQPRDEAYAILNSARTRIMAFTLIAALIAAIGGALAVRRLTRPLVRLRNVVVGLSADLQQSQGHLDQFLVDGSLRALEGTAAKGEVGQLTHAYQDLCVALAQSLRLFQESEGRFRSLFEHANGGIVTIDSQLHFVMVNPASCRFFGYTEAEMLELTIDDVTHPEDRQITPAIREKARSGGPKDIAYEKRYCRKDGTLVWGLVSGTWVLDNEQQPIYAIALLQDITDRKTMEEALRESEERFRSITGAANDAILMIDAEGKIVYWNPAAERIFGYQWDEVEGQDLHSLLAPNSYRNAFEEGFTGFSASGTGAVVGQTLELEARRKDGSEFPIELSVSALKLKDQWHAVGILRDITERKRAEEEIRQAKEAAENANRAKSEFVANMSHELRTPMNGVIGMTELVLDSDLSPEQRECLGLARESAESLLSLLNDILDFSRIEAGKLALESVVFDLRQTFKAPLAAFNVQASKKGVELAVTVDSDVPVLVQGDPSRLRQILINLVGNAIKFTDAGSVEIRVRLEDGVAAGATWPRLHFSVSDTGVGIPAEKLDRIFDSFVQADGSITRKYGGTGLGLAISRELVTMMGGRIWAESVSGQGSTFHFTAELPQGKASDAIQALHATTAGVCASPRRILLAEDNFVNQRLVLGLLEKRGHSVVLAENGQQALEKLELGAYDLILMDVQMPEMDGVEATRIIRSGVLPGVEAQIPIIALTAHAMAGDEERFLVAGMNGYLSKPINAAALIASVEVGAAAAARVLA